MSHTSTASPTSAPHLLIMLGIINASLRKSSCQKYLSYQTRWKENLAEKNIILGIATVEQFLNFLTELFNQGLSHSVLVSRKSAVTHVLRMKYQNIHQHLSVIKYFKGSFSSRLICQSILFFRMCKEHLLYRTPPGDCFCQLLWHHLLYVLGI